MRSINELFGIENYNLIQDDEYIYLFRALNNRDHEDISKGVTTDENGKIVRIRTDRETYIEVPENEEPKYSENDPISLIQVIDHIKRGHRIDTNCISLSSNANISLIYGQGDYHDEYALIRVAKKNFRTETINASEYMLTEIEKRIQDATSNADDETRELIEKVDRATSREEILEIIADLYKMPNADESNAVTYTAERGTARNRIAIRGRFSNYTTLSEEQNLLKNMIVAKLTVLETRNKMKQIMPHTRLDSKVMETLGMALSSSEIIHYGPIDKMDINGNQQMFEVPKEVMHILALLQQTEQQNPNIANRVHNLENEIVEQLLKGELDKSDFNAYDLSNAENERKLADISIKQSYEITNGRLQYEDTRGTLSKVFYISRAVANARNYSAIIDELTGKKDVNADVIETIEKQGLDIEPKLMNRKGTSLHKISESVGISLMKHEEGLVEAIQSLSTDEVADIVNNPENGQKVVRNLVNIQNNPQIPIDEYYARAIFNQYDWERERIHFTQAHKESFIKKIKERPISKLYETLNNTGIENDIISTLLINLIALDTDETNKILDEIEQGNITNEILEKIQNEYKVPLKAEQLEEYLDFYKVEGADFKLRDYQQSAVNNVERIFETHRFASVILPTGAGKSFVALAELLKMQEKVRGTSEKIIYLAPSIEILEQIKKYTEKYVHGEKLNKTREEIFKEIFPNIELATYSSLLQKDDEQLKDSKYKFIVLDELHRTGAEKWEEKLNTLLDAQDESVRVLGITATPQRDRDGRNMADEVALRMGYTKQEIENRKHIAKKMDLIDSIRLGININPRVVECEYNLKTDKDSWQSLSETIEQIDDDSEKEAYHRKYDELRKRVDQAKEIPELFRDSIVKQDGRYIFYMPVGINEYEEDEEGNVIGKKTGANKVKQAEEQLREWLKYIDAEPEFYSMLGEYGDKKNAQQLEQFETSKSKHIKIMIVMNKLNEGVHVDGINGIIWQRALDEESKILLLQQLGRTIYSLGEGEIVNEEDRPVVIDLANNLSRVDLEKVINTYDEIDDIELLQNVVDWIHEHDGILPDINAGFREEARLAATLKRIQKKYIQYSNDDEFEQLDEKKNEKINAILELGTEIDLWSLTLPDKEKKTKSDGKENVNSDNLYDFAVKGVVKDFSDLAKMINAKSNFVDKFIEKLAILDSFGINTRRISRTDTIGTLAKKVGFENSEQLEQQGLKLNHNIGQDMVYVKSVYRGKQRGIPLTDKQINILRDYGISLDKREPNQEFIDILGILKNHGIDVSQIRGKDTIRSLTERLGFTDFDSLKKDRIDLDYKIGIIKTCMSLAHRGIVPNRIPPTAEQVRILQEEYGISLEKQERDITQELIDKLVLLEKNGIDISKLSTKDTIRSLAIKSGLTDFEQLKSSNIDINDKIGSAAYRIRRLYNSGMPANQPTEEQVIALRKYGILTELTPTSTTEKFIKKLEILNKNGIDTSKINSNDTVRTIAIKSGVTDFEQLESAGIRLDDKIGQQKMRVMLSYKGKIKCVPPTEEETQALLKFGIVLTKEEKDANQDYIEKLRILKSNGIDITLIAHSDTIRRLAEKTGFSDFEKLENAGLDLDYSIGIAQYNFLAAFRHKQRRKPPTKEQMAIYTEELGMVLEKPRRNVVQEFIEKLEILKNNGIEVSRIAQHDSIRKLAEKNGFSDFEKLEDAGLDLDYRIGRKLTDIIGAYRGTGSGIQPTEEQIRILSEEYGITLDKQERNITQEFIDYIDVLKRQGIDISLMTQTDTVRTLLEKTGFSDFEALENAGIDLNYKIGTVKSNIAMAYRGTVANRKPPTAEQVQILLEEYGISLEKQSKDTIQKYIDDFRILRDNGIDTSLLSTKDTIRTLAIKSGITDLEKLKNAGINLEDKVGSRKTHMLKAYRSEKWHTPPTPEQIDVIQNELGIKLDKKFSTQDIGQSTYSSPAVKCQEAENVVNGLVKAKQAEEHNKE